MRDCVTFVKQFFYHPRTLSLMKILFFFGVLFMQEFAFAADNSDVLSGTDGSLKATVKGTGKSYIYIIEGLVAIYYLIKTRNLMHCTYIVGISIFLDVIFHFAGY
jgi:branched-subunit amino acid transport protein